MRATRQMAQARKWEMAQAMVMVAMASSIAIWKHSKRRNCVKRFVFDINAKITGYI